MPHGTVVTLLPTIAPVVTRPRVSVVIPTYNEAKNLPHVFDRCPPTCTR